MGGQAWEGCTPRTKEKHTQNEIPDYVPRLAKKCMPNRKSRKIHVEQKVKNWIEKPARVFGGAKIARFDSDHSQPDDRRKPDLDDSFSG